MGLYQGEGVEQDIRSYTHFRLQNDPELRKWQAQRQVQDEIESSVLRNADSM